MRLPENIYLVGPMGAGKTTVGRQLARLLHKEFIDSDDEIEAHTGVSISLIFELEGEAGFRRRERAMLDLLTHRRGVVLATGGGIVLDKANRAHLMSRGFVIYLNPPLERLAERTARDHKRPLLQTQNPRARLYTLARQRDPLYRQVADMIVSTDHKGVMQVARDIIKRLSEV